MDVLVFIISFIAAFVFSFDGVGIAVSLIPIPVFLGIQINMAKPVGLFFNTVSIAGENINNIKK